MNKKNHNHILIDPNFMDFNIISWTQVEVRNPKVDKDINGNDYDGDHPTEPSADFTDVKNSWVTFQTWLNGITINTTKEELEEHINTKDWIDTLLLFEYVDDTDILNHNNLFGCWDKLHYSLMPYDLDLSFGIAGGNNNEGTIELLPNDDTFAPRQKWAPWITSLLSILNSDIEERYSELRRKKVFDIDTLDSMLTEWTKSIGSKNYSEDTQRWNYPQIGGNELNFIDSASRRIEWMRNRISYLDNKYNYNE
jgi:hypothetical protein